MSKSKSYKMRARKVDVAARLLFPIAFVVCLIVYFLVYFVLITSRHRQ